MAADAAPLPAHRPAQRTVRESGPGGAACGPADEACSLHPVQRARAAHSNCRACLSHSHSSGWYSAAAVCAQGLQGQPRICGRRRRLVRLAVEPPARNAASLSQAARRLGLGTGGSGSHGWHVVWDMRTCLQSPRGCSISYNMCYLSIAHIDIVWLKAATGSTCRAGGHGHVCRQICTTIMPVASKAPEGAILVLSDCGCVADFVHITGVCSCSP